MLDLPSRRVLPTNYTDLHAELQLLPAGLLVGVLEDTCTRMQPGAAEGQCVRLWALALQHLGQTAGVSHAVAALPGL